MELAQLSRIRRAAENGSARALRMSAGISLRELARKIEITPGALSMLERGLRRPGPDVAQRWADELEELGGW
ncbi:MAG: helix-turn-helix transcriptional regulator [Acidimicrobiia bacterium]|nr:helix-turn-helix transcriptional regulator [Acidimicrobiia bacterium]